MNDATILRDLKKRVNPDELDVTVQGIRETHLKDLLLELKCSEDIETDIEVEDVEAAVKGFFGHGPQLELSVSLTKSSYRENKKAYVLLEKARALKLETKRCLGFGHITNKAKRKF